MRLFGGIATLMLVTTGGVLALGSDEKKCAPCPDCKPLVIRTTESPLEGTFASIEETRLYGVSFTREELKVVNHATRRIVCQYRTGDRTGDITIPPFTNWRLKNPPSDLTIECMFYQSGKDGPHRPPPEK